MSPEEWLASQTKKPAPESAAPAETTAAGITGAVTRGLALPAAGAAIGAAAGLPFAGVGALPGAVAGAGAATLAGVVGDPIVGAINSLFGTQYTLPTDAMADMLTRIGVPEPRTQAERIVQATAAGAAGAGGTVAAGQALQAAAGAARPVTQQVARMVASQPALQVAGGAGAGLAGQAAQESGAGALGQLAATLGGAMAPVGVAAVPGVVRGVRAAARRQPAAQPQRVEPTVAPMQAAAAPEVSAMPEAPMPQVTAAAAPETAIAAPAASPAMAETAGGVGEVLNLARKAAGVGPGTATAKAKLAEMAQVNDEARAAAERLGMDLPFDVFADNPQVRSAVGLTRALVAGEAEAAWEKTVRRAIERADEISQQFDATFVEGRPSTGMTSQRVLDALKTARQNLADDAKAIYTRINGTDTTEGLIKKKTPVQLNQLRQTLDEITEEVGVDGMTKEEKRLLSMILGKGVDETGQAIGPVTYGRLLREKSLIGKALKRQKSPYENLDESTLKRLYGSLAQDQLDNAEAIAGKETRRQLRIANLMTTKQKALEDRIVGAFGTEIDGSIAQRMQTAISTASKGDAAAFNKLLKVVPAELQKETLATALASVTAGRAAGRAGAGAAETVFNPNEFTKIYRGLRANPPVYAQMVKVMGPEWDTVSRDLYQVSRRIADAQARIPTTGKANQILGQEAVDGLMSRVISSGLSQAIASEVIAKAVPMGGLLSPTVAKMMANTKGAGVQKAAKLFASPEFQELAIQAATQGGQPTQQIIQRTAVSKAFNEFAKAARLPDSVDARVQWLQSAIQSGRQIQPEQEEQQ
jgi:hypothetical protein